MNVILWTIGHFVGAGIIAFGLWKQDVPKITMGVSVLCLVKLTRIELNHRTKEP